MEDVRKLAHECLEIRRVIVAPSGMARRRETDVLLDVTSRAWGIRTRERTVR
jgi:hypothetical protein